MSLVEMLVVSAISVFLIGAISMIWHSSRLQEQSVSRHVEVQRGLRGSMLLIQRDLRSLKETLELEREKSGSLRRLVIRIPSEGGKSTTSVTYTFEKKSEQSQGVFRRNGRILFEDSLTDFQIFPFNLEDGIHEVKDSVDFGRIHLVKVKLSFVPGKGEFARHGEERSFSFSIYPRTVNSRRRSILSRFNLQSGRFGNQGRASPTPSVEEPE